jgi:prepilin-type N-terminal cleavage/methylation domain-containing protein
MSKSLKTAVAKKAGNRPHGLTLIEMLIVVAISAIILVALLSLYMAGQKYFFNENAKADTIEDSRYPMTWISRDIREAFQVVASHGAYATTSSSVVLELPSIDPATGGLLAGNLDYIIYRRNPTESGKLERIIDASASSRRQSGTRVLADNVSAFSLAFYKDDGTTVASPVTDTFIMEVSLMSSAQGIHRKSQPFQEAFTSRVKLRNKAVS